MKLKQIKQSHVQMCLKPADFGGVSSISLHHFLMHLSLTMGEAATLRWLARKAKFISVCCLERQYLYQ